MNKQKSSMKFQNLEVVPEIGHVVSETTLDTY